MVRPAAEAASGEERNAGRGKSDQEEKRKTSALEIARSTIDGCRRRMAAGAVVLS